LREIHSQTQASTEVRIYNEELFQHLFGIVHHGDGNGQPTMVAGKKFTLEENSYMHPFLYIYS
jgi:hypothetical protein